MHKFIHGYTVQQAAKELGCSVHDLRQLILRGQLRRQRVDGRSYIIPLAALEKFQEHQKPVGRPRPYDRFAMATLIAIYGPIAL